MDYPPKPGFAWMTSDAFAQWTIDADKVVSL
jgi:hypothetical protein